MHINALPSVNQRLGKFLPARSLRNPRLDSGQWAALQ